MRAEARRRALLAITAALVCPASGAAQADLGGAWDVRWAQAVRVYGDGSLEVQRWGDARLELTQRGSELTGTWTTNVAETVSWTVTGAVDGDHITLEATEHDSDNPELAIVERIDWEATLTDGSLEGHVMLVIGGRDRPPGRRPFTATRRSGEVQTSH